MTIQFDGTLEFASTTLNALSYIDDWPRNGPVFLNLPLISVSCIASRSHTCPVSDAHRRLPFSLTFTSSLSSALMITHVMLERERKPESWNACSSRTSPM